ncbi:hypothetical protein [Bacillus fonticola]|uniref:hypothetical protein n=1 Tax=Bacillus fonticola TaxID=2728853 RepID=UPI001474EF85|nr:hypothetical protein [Bacillus fonticola]
MKKIVYLLLILILSLAYVSPSYANAAQNSGAIEDKFSYPIKSLETGEEIGVQTYEITSTIKELHDSVKEITLKITTTEEFFSTGEEKVKTDEKVLVFEDEKLISINGETIKTDSDQEVLSLSESDQEKIKPYAEKLRQGDLDYTEYVEQLKGLDLDIYQDNQPEDQPQFSIQSSGGLEWVTHYYSSYQGGYYLEAHEMEGYFTGTLHSFMLDSDAVVPDSGITKHNYLTSDQGGLVAQFMSRADSISSARTELSIEATALMGALGVGVLTIGTVIGALTAAGAAGAIAARMYSVSSSAHTDIERAYEIVQSIRNQP